MSPIVAKHERDASPDHKDSEVTAVMTLTLTFNQHSIDDSIMNLGYMRTAGI
jgi:hypothetical protein